MKTIINKIKTIKYFTALVCVMLLSSCETTDLDVNVNPNALSPSSADPTLVLNGIQASFTGQSFNLHANVRGVMRHVNMFGTYAANTPSSSLNGAWSSTYAIAANRQLLETLNETQALGNHVGIAQLLEAFAYVNLVDFIGTAVFSEAVNPDISAPNFDNGADIYNALYTQINTAITNLSLTDQVAFEDLYFNGDLSKWIRLANSLKIKMYVQSKLVGNANAGSDINAIVASGNYISSGADDFLAQFGTQNDNPDVRHPDFVAAYVTGAGGQYMSNEFMNILLNDKTIEDPRMKYYVYRQSLTTPAADLLPCAGNPAYALCHIGDFYWGRDHADDEGIPNDGNQRTTYGAYPAGGAFDTGAGNVSTINTQNLGGAGIYPIVLSSFTNFMLAESALPAPVGLGTTGSSRTFLEAAMRDSFSKVEGFVGVTMSNVDAYVNEVLTNFDNATSDSARLNIIIKEYYIASWGNSIEAFNNYRRTGFPDLGGSVGSNTDFPRNFLIPDSELNSNDNPNLIQINRTDQVFWDTNPAGFVN